MLRHIVLLSLFTTAFCSAVVKPRADCTREFLKEIADSYVTAQTTGQIASLRNVADTLVYIESDVKMDIKSGVLSQALPANHTRHSLDTTACATYTELISANTRHPYVIGTQIRTTDGKITQIDSMVSDQGDWLFNATGTLRYANQENWSEIPLEKRDTRAVIQAAGDAYLDLFGNKSVKVPWGTPCARLEGGSYTGRGQPTDSCNVGIPARNAPMPNRRYVVDEVMGAVSIFLKFGAVDGPPDSHEFRIEGGKLRFVHTMTINNGKPLPV